MPKRTEAQANMLRSKAMMGNTNAKRRPAEAAPRVMDKVKSRMESTRVFHKLLDVGEANNLGGTGTPVAIVVVYPNQAFVKAGWTRDKVDVVQALMDALEDEARRDG